MISETQHLQQNDQELINKIANKDKHAFSMLYDKYAKALYGLIFSITGNKLISEEILQSVFCMVWNLASDYLPAKQRLFTWMLRIAGGLAKENQKSVNEQIHPLNNYVNDPKDLINLDDSKSVIGLVFSKGHPLHEAGLTAEFGTQEIKKRLRLECNAIRDYK